jgi:AT hook motif
MAETKDEKEQKGTRPRGRPAKYDAEGHSDAIHDELAELADAEIKGSAVDENAIAKQALDFHDAYRTQAWYQLVLETAKES